MVVNMVLGNILPRNHQHGGDDDAPEGHGLNLIVTFLQDIFILVASFVCSIFPMWNPQGPPRRPHRDGENNENEARAPLLAAQLDRADLADLPPVAAPRNVLEEASDEDEDSDDSEEDHEDTDTINA